MCRRVIMRRSGGRGILTPRPPDRPWERTNETPITSKGLFYERETEVPGARLLVRGPLTHITTGLVLYSDSTSQGLWS